MPDTTKPDVTPIPVLSPIPLGNLAFSADVVDDLEKVRIANENRLRQLTRNVPDEDGVMRGFGLDESHPDVARLSGIVEALSKLEHEATLALQKQLRLTPFKEWQRSRSALGVGEKQLARLLAAIGDPYWHNNENRVRLVSELWAYSGFHVVDSETGGPHHFNPENRNSRVGSTPDQPDTESQVQTVDHDGSESQGSNVQGSDETQISSDQAAFESQSIGVAPKRKRGQQSNWSTTAKTRAILIAMSCIKKMDSPFRKIYDDRRARTAKTHPDWTPLHSHNDAIRVTAKAVLKELYAVAEAFHQGMSDQLPKDVAK